MDSSDVCTGRGTLREGGNPEGGAPERGEAAPGVPSLVNNPPNTEQGASWATKWTKQQCKIRRVCVDRLRYWKSHGYEVLWVTLTSGVGAKAGDADRRNKKLRRDMQEVRRRVGVRWGMAQIEYVCVETLEGNGVLHMLWAAKATKGQFYIPQKWLSEQWQEIHGAWNVWVARVREGQSSTRRLSRYIVSQYCAGQDGLVRLSQSRMGLPFAKLRKALLATMKACTDRYTHFGELPAAGIELGRLVGAIFWHYFKRGWETLVECGECSFFGHRYVWFLGELQEV